MQEKEKLIEALQPFASFGPDVAGLHDNQAFMGAAQIKAGHFKKAYQLLQELKLNVKKTNP
jgi:hypothetical protein